MARLDRKNIIKSRYILLNFLKEQKSSDGFSYQESISQKPENQS